MKRGKLYLILRTLYVKVTPRPQYFLKICHLPISLPVNVDNCQRNYDMALAWLHFAKPSGKTGADTWK